MNKFKDQYNRWLITALFWGVRDNNLDYVLYNIGDEDKVVDGRELKSIKRLYLSCTDPTEYEFANKYLGGWEHWKRIQDSELMKPYIESWREEFEVKTRAEALKQIMVHAKTDKGYQASRFLADCGWKQRPAGAPSKEEKEGIRKQVERANNVISLDAERLGFVKEK